MLSIFDMNRHFLPTFSLLDDADVPSLPILCARQSSLSRAPATAGARLSQPMYRVQHERDGVRVEVDMPGVRRDDITVEVRGDTLSVVAARSTLSSSKSDSQPDDHMRTAHRDKPTHDNSTTVIDDNEDRAAVDDDDAQLKDTVHETHPTDEKHDDREQHENNSKKELDGDACYAHHAISMRLKLKLGRGVDMQKLVCDSYRDGVLTLRAPLIQPVARRIEVAS